MKRKQVNATAKSVKQMKVSKKAAPPKVVEEEVEESEEEVEVPVPKVVSKKGKKQKAPVVEEPVIEEEEDEEEADEDDEEVDEEEADEEDEENEEEENEEDEAMEEEEDDEAPSEEVIGTEEPTIPSKVKSGQIPPTVPVTRIVHVSNLPKKCKQINIVEVFAKYGAIDQIHLVTTLSGTAAKIAYKTEKAALAALADDRQVKVIDNPVFISMRSEKNKVKIELNRERCVHVKNIKNGTTQEQLKEHFESCGEVDNIKLVNKHNTAYAYVTFNDKSAVPAALKLHNSLLNGSNIKVTENTENREIQSFDELRTVMMRNKQSFDSIDVKKLETIFSKCGEIDFIELVCRKQILAFITFKSEEAAQKALKLNGKTLQDIELELEMYTPTKKWTSIHVTNLPKDCTEEDLTKHFSKAGEIANVVLKKGFAIIRFNDSDGYCKSFLYNESFIKGHIIFIEPHSTRKQSVLKHKGFHKKGFKRSYENGHSAFKAKKFRSE